MTWKPDVTMDSMGLYGLEKHYYSNMENGNLVGIAAHILSLQNFVGFENAVVL